MSGSDDLGGLGELDDGGDDLGGLDGDEELGGFDDDFGEMEGGDDMAGGGGNVDELEHRLDELENEVGSLSSTVNTVRNENEQISNSVEEVEENVRKLLDIYEMVTRGVNPFADEMDGGMGMGGGQMDAQDSSFGLFTDDEEEQEESVDEDIADADAEGFFDDELVDDEDAVDEEIDADMTDAFQEDGDSAAEAESEFDDAEEFDEIDDGFEDVDNEFDDITNDGLDDAEMGAESKSDEMAGEELADDDLFDETIETEPMASEESDGQTTAVPKESNTAASGDTGTQGAMPDQTNSGTDPAGKPYLSHVPDGVTGDLVVIEWLEYLVAEVGSRGASEAIRYYETIDWVTEDVADQLSAHLEQFERGERGSLSIYHHRQSLDYIDQLNGGDATQQPAVFGGGESL